MKIRETLRALSQSLADLRRDLQLGPPLLGSQQPRSDTRHAGASSLLTTSATASLHFGVVTDYIPHMRAYRVMAEYGSPLILCTTLMQGNPQPLGVSACDSYLPGTHVYYIRHPASTSGVILGAVPVLFSDSRQGRSDWITPGSRTGILVDQAYKAPFALGGQGSGGGLKNWSSRAPMDDIAGSFTRSTETGLLLHMDSYMLQARVDEVTGLYLYYWDQLCRLTGYNFQLWTSGSEHESLDDEGEHLWYHGICAYPWEQHGRYNSFGQYSRTNTPADVQQRKQHESYREPEYPDLQPFHRTQIYRGYLGQGTKELQVAPPKEGDFQRFSVQDELRGLAEKNTLLDGHILYRSARGITLAKRPLIPVPKRKLLAPDPTGDKPDNYKASGQLGDGAEHKVASTLPDSDVHPSLARVASILDQQTYAFNWKALHQFHYHQQDFDVPDEYELDLKPVQTIPSFGDLLQQPYLNPPTPIEVDVDHRHKTKVYPNMSGVDLLDDGSVVIGDGYGSQIRMTGGNVFISCPGDVFLEAGRNITQWAGRDAIVRAKQSIDLTATDGDLRLKAEKNLQVLGGNGGGSHGVMIESRGTGTEFDFAEPGEATLATGLVLKSGSSPVVVHGDQVYLRSTGGNLVLDANKGRSSCLVHASDMTRFLATSALDYFGSEGNVSAANVWGPGVAMVGGSLHVNGACSISSSAVVRGGVSIVSGHIQTDAGDEKVRQIQGGQVETSIRAYETALQQSQQNGGTQYQSKLQTSWYDDNRAGNDDVVDNAQCSLRVVDDYNAADFVLFETQWAQLARSGGGPPATWKEKPVRFRGQDTYPFPGKENFEGTTYYTVDQQLYDFEKGAGKDRGADYENAGKPVPSAKKLDGNYPIVG